MMLNDTIVADAVHRVLRTRYEKGDVWAVELPVRTGDNVGWEWRFTPDEVLVDPSGVLYVERRDKDDSYRVVLYLAPGQWKKAVRL